MRSAHQVLQWQLTRRDAYSLRLMDRNGDGVTTNDEVKAGLPATPSAVYGLLEPYLNTSGSWQPADLERLIEAQSESYEKLRESALSEPDAAAYPSAENPVSSYGWWKSWFTDDVANADRLAKWGVPALLHYGSTDSQTPPSLEAQVAIEKLGTNILVRVHKDLGYSLGHHVLLGPIDDSAPQSLVADINIAVASCD